MTPLAKSPIAQLEPVAVVDGWLVSQRKSGAPLLLVDCTPMAKVLIKSDANGQFTAKYPVIFGRAKRNDNGVLEIGCDPGAWLMLGPVGAAQTIIDQVNVIHSNEQELISVIDMTHGRALIRLSGSDAVRLLSKICAINLSDSVTPNLSAFRSSVAKLVTDVVRDDLPNGTRSYLLHCERSSGQHLFNCVLDAGSEFGIDVDGWR